MQTELRDKHDFSEELPLPPTPHFDLASIAEAKPVQPLRRRRIPRYSSGMLRLGTAIFAGLIVMVFGVATMARLNKQINAGLASAAKAESAAATADAAPDVDAESIPVASPNDQGLVGTERRRHRGPRHFRAPREMFEPQMFEFDQPPIYGRPRARLVTVIQ